MSSPSKSSKSFIEDIITHYVFTGWTGRSILFVESPYFKGVEKTGQVYMTTVEELMPLVLESWQGRGSIRFSINPRYQGINNVWYLERLMWDFDVGENMNINPRLIINVALQYAARLSTICGVKPIVVFSGGKGAHVIAFLSQDVQSITQDKPQGMLEYVHRSLYMEVTNYLRTLLPGLSVLEDSGANYKVLTKLPYTRHEKTLSETYIVDSDGYYVPPIDAVKYIDEAIEHPAVECTLGTATINLAEYVKELMSIYEEERKKVQEEVEERVKEVVEEQRRAPGTRKNKFAEYLLQNPPNDCKKRLIIVVLAPYLVNEQGMSDEEAIEVLTQWCVKGGGRQNECRTVSRNAVKNARKKQLNPPHNPYSLLYKGWNKAFNFEECKDLIRGMATLLGYTEEKVVRKNY